MTKKKLLKRKAKISKTNNEIKSPHWRSYRSDTGEVIESSFAGGNFSVKPETEIPSLKKSNSNYSRILNLLRAKGAVGSNGLPTSEIKSEFFKTYGVLVKNISDNLSILASKKLVFARPDTSDARITLWSLPDGTYFLESKKKQSGLFTGGRVEAIGSKTPSIKDPDSYYSRILAIVGEQGLTSHDITNKFNKTYGTNKSFTVIKSKLTRLAAKGLIAGKPDPKDARITVWFKTKQA